MVKRKTKYFPVRLILTRFGWSALLATAMMLVAFAWLNIDYNLTVEDTFFTWELQLKRMTGLDRLVKDSVSTGDVTMIDMSGAKQFALRNGEAGNETIEDHFLLDTLLQLLAKRNSHRFIVCDVLLDSSLYIGPNLATTAVGVKNIIFPYTQDGSTQVRPNPRIFPGGYVGYTISHGYFASGNFLKFKYWRGKASQSLPLLMYEKLYGEDFIKAGPGIIQQKGRLFFNSTLLDLRLRSDTNKGNFRSPRLWSIQEFISALRDTSQVFKHDFVDGKYIVIGDFRNDMHPTVLGSMPGPVLLMDLYLGLANGDNHVTLVWVLFMFTGLTLTAAFILYPHSHPFFRFATNIARSPLSFFFKQTFFLTVALFTLSFLSYLLAGKEFDILVVLLFIGLFEGCRNLSELLKVGRVHYRQGGFRHAFKILAKPKKK